MKKQMNPSPHINLQEVESHLGIPASDAREIAKEYRLKGGYKINISEHENFRSDITVSLLDSNDIQGQYREVNR